MLIVLCIFFNLISDYLYIGGLKPLRKEIDRRIEYASHITTEPRLVFPQQTNPDLQIDNIR